MPTILGSRTLTRIKGLCQLQTSKIPSESIRFVLVEGGEESLDRTVFSKLFDSDVLIQPCRSRSEVLDDITECIEDGLDGICIVDRDYFPDDELGTDNIVSFCLDSNNIESFLLKYSISKIIVEPARTYSPTQVYTKIEIWTN